jgi:nitrate reductase alpha subunit
MAKIVVIVALTWSLMRASDTWLNEGRFTDAALFIALTALIWASAAHQHKP